MFEGVDTAAALPLLDTNIVPPATIIVPPATMLPEEGIDFLQPAELNALTDAVASSQYDYDTIYVWGRRYYDGWSYGGGGGGGGGDNSNTNDQETTGGQDPPPAEVYCLSADALSQLTPKELEAYQVAVVAAKIAREIYAMPDRDHVEYGAIIYRDTDGVIKHTPLTRGTASSLPEGVSIAGTPGWGSALGLIHSHPALLYNEAYPLFRMHPTPYGDWAAFNWMQEQIVFDLTTNHGWSFEAASNKALGFVQFMLGANGDVGTGYYGFYRYDDGGEANQTRSSFDQLMFADSIDFNLGLCDV